MQYIKRLIVFVTLVMAPGFPTTTIDAQGVSCFGLPQADCKIVADAEANLGKETSFNYDFDFSTKGSASGQSWNASAKGKGVFAYDADAIDDITDQLSIYKAIKMTLDVTGSVNTSGRGSAFKGAGKTSFIMVDGVMYTQTPETDNRWVGVRVEDALRRSSANGTNPVTGLPTNNDIATEFFSDPEVMAAIAAIPKINGFIKLQKTRSTPLIDGQRQIEFVYTLDFQKLLRARELYPIYKGLVKASGTDTTNLNELQLAGVGDVFARTIAGTTLKVTRWIGSKDKLYHGMKFDAVLKLNTASFGGFMGPSTTVSATMQFQVRLTKIGAAVKVEAPPDADITE